MNGTSYEFEMTFSGQSSGTIAGYVYYMGPSNAHTLVNSFTFDTGGTYLSVANAGGCSNAFIGFTDYQEIFSTNSVEEWPAFNFHSGIAVLPVSGTTQLPWTNITIGCFGDCPPSGYPGGLTTSYSSPQNFVAIQNQPFLVEIGTNWGHGEAKYTLAPDNLPTSFMVPIAPMEDPKGGYDVNYDYNYCSIPCGDVTFSVPDSPVEVWSSSFHTNAYMIITLPKGFAAGTYPMNLYSWWPDAGSAGISSVTLVIT
ncbi:MAG: hypothetical protein WA688_03860 [Thermoplasmata archaeon]